VSIPSIAATRGKAHVDRSDADFVEFVTGSVGRLTQFAELLTGDPHRAADLVQESLERAYIRWPKVEVDDPHAYVRQIIVNQYRNWWRRRRSREVLIERPPDTVVGEDHAVRLAQSDLLRRALATLTTRERAVVVLRFYSDLDIAAIAAETGIAPGTVKSTLSRAMGRMREFPGLDDSLAERER
jgi:RNA polymerase sigma-70 factor (sigma-E family)